MENFKGTKDRKWEVLNTNSNKEWVNIGQPEDVIARTFYGDIKPIITKEEAEANAKLIAAAPDILKALQKITEMNYQTAEDQYGDRNKAKNWACVTVAEEAIKKALE